MNNEQIAAGEAVWGDECGGCPPTGRLLTERSVDEVLQERGDRYGKFINNATVAQNIKEAMQCDTRYHELSADKREALDQIASKISRIVTANASEYKDSWTDICGYAKLVADTLED
jgi:hypothetical protein